MAAAWVSAIATAFTALNGFLQYRHRRKDDRRFAEVHERLDANGK